MDDFVRIIDEDMEKVKQKKKYPSFGLYVFLFGILIMAIGTLFDAFPIMVSGGLVAIFGLGYVYGINEGEAGL